MQRAVSWATVFSAYLCLPEADASSSPSTPEEVDSDLLQANVI